MNEVGRYWFNKSKCSIEEPNVHLPIVNLILEEVMLFDL